MLQRLPIALAQVKTGNNSKSLLNEIRKIVYSLYQSKQITTGWPIKMPLYFFGDNFYKIKEISRFFLCRYWGATSRNEAPLHFSNRYLNISRIASHEIDSFRVKPITPGHSIPKISTRLTIFWGVNEKQNLWKQSTDKRGHHQKRNQTDSTINAQQSCGQF